MDSVEKDDMSGGMQEDRQNGMIKKRDNMKNRWTIELNQINVD